MLRFLDFCRASSVLVFVALLGIGGLGTTPVEASGLDTGLDQTLVGSRTKPAAGTRIGVVHVGRGRLAPTGASQTWRGWVADVPSTKGSLADGFVRADLRTDSEMDVVLGVRLAVEPSTGEGSEARVRGYGVRLEGGAVQVVRVDGEQLTPLGVREPIYRFRRRKSLSVQALVVGSRLVIEVHDGRSGRHLVSLEHDGIEARGDRVGVLFGPRSPARASVRLLAARRACHGAPGPTSASGEPRYVTIAAAAVGRLPAPLAKRMTLMEQIPEGSVLRTDLLGLEALHCARVPVSSVAVETPWKYVDDVYREKRHQPPEPTERGLRVADTYHDDIMIERMFLAWNARYPELTQIVDLGRSNEGRKILAMRISRAAAGAHGKAAVFLNGGHHGNELMAPEFVLDAIDWLLSNQGHSRQADRLLDDLVIWAVPLVNPDGRHHFLNVTQRTGRKNGRDTDGTGHRERLDGVDLNRNYPFRWHSLGERGSRSSPTSTKYRGEGPASEPETEAIMRLADAEKFVASLSYHTGTVAVLAPYTIDGATDPSPNEAWLVADGLVKKLKTHPEAREWELKRNLYAVDGTDQDWHRAAHGTVALLIEGANRSPRTVAGRRQVLENVRPTWQLLFRRYLRGPTIFGTVRDVDGRPVPAEVRLVQQRLRDGERWTARCRDGRFDRILARSGRWTVEVRMPNRAPVRKEVVVPWGRRVQVDIELPYAVPEQRVCPQPGYSKPIVAQ